MESIGYLVSFIAVATLATFLTRAIPFLVFRKSASHPLFEYLGRFLPLMLMVVLVIYASKDLSLSHYAALALLSVALLQWYVGNAMLSILVGTFLYAMLS